MTSIIVFATIALIALGAFAIINTVQKFEGELERNVSYRKRSKGYTGVPSVR